MRGAFATTSVELTYINPEKDAPLECKFTLPVEKTSTVAKFEAEIDGKVITTKV